MLFNEVIRVEEGMKTAQKSIRKLGFSCNKCVRIIYMFNSKCSVFKRFIKNCCFSCKLKPGFKEANKNLKNLFLSAQEVAVIFDKKINTTWKVHILLCHLKQYVEHLNQGWVTLPNNAEKVLKQSINQHDQGLRDKRASRLWGKTTISSCWFWSKKNLICFNKLDFLLIKTRF